MLKKILLSIILITTITVGQVENTSLQWTSFGNPASTQLRHICMINDTLYVYVGTANGHRHSSGTTWSGAFGTTQVARLNYAQVTWGVTGGISTSYFTQIGDTVWGVNVGMNPYSWTNRQGWSNLPNNVYTDNNNVPSPYTVYAKTGFMRTSIGDSIIAYGVSSGYDFDTTTVRASAHLNTNSPVMSWSTKNTNLPFQLTGTWLGWRPIGTFELGGSVFVLTGRSDSYANSLTDTIRIYKSNDGLVGLNFSLTDKLEWPNNQYGGIHSQQAGAIGDSIYYIFMTNATLANQGLYAITSDGTISQVVAPTSLDEYGGFVTSRGEILISVTDNSINNGIDSSKIYIRDNSGNWTYKEGPRDAVNVKRVPNAFKELDGTIYAYMQYWEAPYTAMHSSSAAGGYIWSLAGFLSITSPLANDSYTAEDVTISWSGDQDTVVAYYSDDNVNWFLIDTLDSSPYTWVENDILLTGLNGDAYIRLTSTDSSVVATTGLFTYLSAKSIEILSPVDSVATFEVGDPLSIIVRTVLVDSISLFYSVGDTLSWVLIETDIKTPAIVDTVIYSWTIPNVYGTIYLLATENLSSDTVDITASIPYVVGSSIPSQPAVCWWNIEDNIIEYRAYYDQTCLWGDGAPMMKVTSTIQSDGYGYDFIYELCDEGNTPGNIICATTNPLTQGYAWVVNGLDTTAVGVNDMYTSGDTITYNLRRYYVGVADSVLYCDDLVNGIDSLVVCDLSEYWDDLFVGPLNGLTLYDIQVDKIQNDTLDINDIDEDLNDLDFKVKVMVSGPARRGTASLVFEALEQPNSTTAVYDIATMFSGLTIQRDYFRGIDPKARKKGR